MPVIARREMPTPRRTTRPWALSPARVVRPTPGGPVTRCGRAPTHSGCLTASGACETLSGEEGRRMSDESPLPEGSGSPAEGLLSGRRRSAPRRSLAAQLLQARRHRRRGRAAGRRGDLRPDAETDPRAARRTSDEVFQTDETFASEGPAERTPDLRGESEAQRDASRSASVRYSKAQRQGSSTFTRPSSSFERRLPWDNSRPGFTQKDRAMHHAAWYPARRVGIPRAWPSCQPEHEDAELGPVRRGGGAVPIPTPSGRRRPRSRVPRAAGGRSAAASPGVTSAGTTTRSTTSRTNAP